MAWCGRWWRWGRKPGCTLRRYAENFQALILDYLAHWLDREPQAAGGRAEVAGIEIDNASSRLDKALKSRGGALVGVLDYVEHRTALRFDRRCATSSGITCKDS
ncbi:MAG: hypothetical protein IPO75_13805 [Betaproteobacteria bacterium]|nr:hypothetical protein [Betaproteobacteria bacterium]